MAVAIGAALRYLSFKHPVSRLVDESKRLHRKKAYDASLAAAIEACKLAAADGSSPPQQQSALLHLAALHHAMNRFDDALSTLNEVEAKMTEAKMTDLDLVPVLHARAEVLESSGKPLALVAAQFTRARDIRKRSGRAMDAANAAMNLARVLTCQSQEVVDVASKASSNWADVAPLQQAESLALEAHGIALAAGDASQAAGFVDEILDILRPSVASSATIERLCAAYLDAAGKEWTRKPLDVVVVGGGASGVGMGLMLTKIFKVKSQRVLLVERGGGVGESFRQWPKEMRFISPSFNQQGWTKSFDLNSVAYGTSPAFTLHAEHPTGEQYANYLRTLAAKAKLNVQCSTEVKTVRPLPNEEGFEVELVPAGGEPTILRSRYVIWAAGEFQYPRASGALFPGSELCLHNSSVRSWKELPGEDFVVIGGYESGMDAASNLATCGKRCTVVSSTACWRVQTEDPSTELAPYTAERIRAACATPTPPRLLAPLRVFAVERREEADGGGFVVRARWGPPTEHPGGEYRESVGGATAEEQPVEGTEVSLYTPQQPVLCAGFEGSILSGVAKDLFEWSGEKEEKQDEADQGAGQEEEGNEGKEKEGKGCAAGAPLLTEDDESTKTAGLFLVGPAVRHGELSFCFVYKFRQRFGIVADVIARGLGLDTKEAVHECREMNMFLDDFTCCNAACGETC